MANGLVFFALALQQFYPFTPEEVGLYCRKECALDWKNLTWDEESGQVKTPDGSVIEKLTGVFPNLNEITVRYKWQGPWPEEIPRIDDDDEEEAEEESNVNPQVGEGAPPPA